MSRLSRQVSKIEERFQRKLENLRNYWMLLIPGTGNGERESGNECTAVTRLIIQNGGRRKRRKEVSRL